MASATDKKIDALYGKLGEKERVPMLAKLSREHVIAGMEKLRNATSPKHADAYNQALKLLRVLNGNLTDWLASSRRGWSATSDSLLRFLAGTAPAVLTATRKCSPFSSITVSRIEEFSCSLLPESSRVIRHTLRQAL